jgi:hypothetical protein
MRVKGVRGVASCDRLRYFSLVAKEYPILQRIFFSQSLNNSIYFAGPRFGGTISDGQVRVANRSYKQIGKAVLKRRMTMLTTSTRDVITQTAESLDKLVAQVRAEISQVSEPKAQALLETTAEVLIGLKKAYEDYKRGGEKAWD